MDWREFLEKDSLDGKQGHDPKKFEWNSHYTDNKEEITDMKPEDFQDLTVGQAGSDAHARHPKNMFPEKKNPKTGKYEQQKPKRDSFIDSKVEGDERYPIDPKRSKDERPEIYRRRERNNHRGDELGAVEGYKRQLRHGGKPEIPALGTRTDSQGRKHVTDHEGRHRAQAALEEGEKTIPVAVNHNRGSMALGREKRLNQKEIDEMGGEQGEPTSPRHNRDRISSGINSMHYHNQPKDKKIQQGMEALKSWESWLDKVDESRPDGDDWNDRHLPVPKITIHEIKEDDSFEEKQRKLHQLSNYNDSQDMNDGLIRENEDIDNTKVKKLLKNNAIETPHKEDEKKHEWDGKFSSSTIRDDVKDDDKAVSEEESLEELTDGKLEEIEKLKSDVDKIITDLARKIKNPKRREDIVQRQAEQKVKETVTKAWELFLVNKMPMNQYDKQPQKKRTIEGDGVTLDTNLGIVKDKLTETVTVKNPRGSLGNKKVKRIDHEAGDGSRKIVEIPKEENTNPEVKYMSGGRPEEPNVVGDLKHGSVNSSDGRHIGREIEEGAENNSVLYNALAEEEKEKEVDNKTDDEVTISNDETDHATGVTEETPAQKRARIIRQFDRKKRDKKGNIIKSWENWLEKKSRFKPSNPLHRNIHPHNIPIKDDPYYKNVDLSVDYSQTADARAGDDEYDAIRREKIRREGYHKKSWEAWLEKENKPKKYSGLTPKQRKLQESIDSENDSDNQYYTKAWELWLEKACKGGNCGDRKMWEAFRTHHYENKDRKRSKEDLDIFDSNIIIHDNNGAGSKELKNTNSGRRLNDRIRTTTPKAGAKRNQIDVELAHEMKSWEVWLEKDAMDGKQGIDKLPKSSIKPILADAQEVIDRDNRGKKNEMYKSWLEKMQGAGDARYGNQHLTGLDQKPVNNEEDEANILPEKEEKTDNKEKKQEETDNKPYKALGGE